ncbi:MAG: hypothetical protein AB7T10_01885, partial [bacterium]
MKLIENGVFKSIKTERYNILYKGLPFKLGVPSEQFSQWLLSSLEKRKIDEFAREISGIYFLHIKDLKDGKTYSFVDNSSISKVYFGRQFISTSLLQLAKHEGLTTFDLNKERILEYIRFGGFFPPDTLFDSIKQITGDEVLYINKENEFKLIKKTENVSSIEFVDF